MRRLGAGRRDVLAAKMKSEHGPDKALDLNARGSVGLPSVHGDSVGDVADACKWRPDGERVVGDACRWLPHSWSIDVLG